MGRSPLSGWPLLQQLRRAGLHTHSFGYAVSRQDFASISRRLAARIGALAAQGDYVLVGHSLGGVLIRAALNGLPPGVARPQRIFLLGSPQQPARLARQLRGNPLYRALTRDCGRLLGSAERMAAVGAVDVPTTSIVGVSGPRQRLTPFAGELNDGVVSLAEVSADWVTDQVQVGTLHTFLPMDPGVARIILQRLQDDGVTPGAAAAG
jgi:hypothetical protein